MKKTLHPTPKQRQAARAQRTAERKERARKLAGYRAADKQARAGAAIREADTTGRLQALYDAFIPTAIPRGITSKYVDDKYGNRVRRTEVTV